MRLKVEISMDVLHLQASIVKTSGREVAFIEIRIRATRIAERFVAETLPTRPVMRSVTWIIMEEEGQAAMYCC